MSIERARIRRFIGKRFSESIYNLITTQNNSYTDDFLQLNTEPDKRQDKGLQAIFKSAFPMQNQNGTIKVEFVEYQLETPQNTPSECQEYDLTYSSILKATLRLIASEYDEDTKTYNIIDVKEEKGVFFCEMPLPDESGAFIINGIKKIIVSQIHRSPGLFFNHDGGKVSSSGKLLYSAKLVPYRGAWLDLEFDSSDVMYFRIDKKRKLPITMLLKAIGMDNNEILKFFYPDYEIHYNGEYFYKDFVVEHISQHHLKNNLIDAKTNNIVLQAGEYINSKVAQKLWDSGCTQVVVHNDELIGLSVAENVTYAKGAKVLSAGQEITEHALSLIKNNNVSTFKVISLDPKIGNGPALRNTLLKDFNTTQEDALIEICRVLRIGTQASKEIGLALLDSLFFNPARYDLSAIGRIKLNHTLGLNTPETCTVLSREDIKHIVLKFAMLKDGKIFIDDIDHLGNRRVRTSSELIENQLKIGFNRAQKIVDDLVSNTNTKQAKPSNVLNLKFIAAALKEFFNTSQLVQFMDQTNPLSELTHKKRLSALGPGGVSRDRAGLEIRDVHTTHYSRICAVETPEGQNIGLINSLTTCAKINKYGFLEAPYFRVIDGKVTDEIVYLNASEEEKYYMAQSGLKLNSEGQIEDELVHCRYKDDFIHVNKDKVNFVDISPVQVVSIATSLIPFIENNDAKRSLMGANMQKQAVPLIRVDPPLVGTGIENVIGHDKGTSVVANEDGIVEYVDGSKIIINAGANKADSDNILSIYHLNKFARTNYNTCINQRAIVYKNQKIKKGQVIADGHSISQGELSLGASVLVAVMPYKGYTFQDSIVISERIIKDDLFTSIHIEELEIVVRDTRLGPEEITKDIPNASQEALSNLDEVGIVHIGAKVKPRDILVGKVTPQSEKPLTPEEKMLKAIFGEKANNVVDSSLYVPFGVSGTVIDVKILSRRGMEKDERTLMQERELIAKAESAYKAEAKIITNFFIDKLQNLLIGQKTQKKLGDLAPNTLFSKENIGALQTEDYMCVLVSDESINNKISEIKDRYNETIENLKKSLAKKIDKIKGGSSLSQGALKVLKVFIACRNSLQPGDKMSGRHGNKGVVSKVVPEEDMPFLEDGTVVDVILNPLGIPSRMNIGQIFETHLGWASKCLGKKIQNYLDDFYNNQVDLNTIKEFVYQIYSDDELETIKSMSEGEFLSFAMSIKDGVHFATLPFSGNKTSEIKRMLKLSGQDESGQVRLIDGCTGEYIDKKVTIGIQYLLKLHHLVEDKVHARSVGPYSLVTQQPLGGRGQFGGQRLGEMEVWALQAYGAAYTLQEMVTIKSDDVIGREKVYQEITKGSHNFVYGIPESFNVILKEMQALCLNVRLEKKA
jgi:DNA-directed RNA polymerase subunit beta